MGKEGACSFTSARLEPWWLARIQPHSVFDEGWILKLNQSHMSPTERARGRQTGLKDRERDRGGGMYKGTKGGMEDRKGEKSQEMVDGKRGGVTAGEKKSHKKGQGQYTAKWPFTKSYRELVWDFSLVKKQTTVQSETVFIMHKYLSGYMSHREPGFMQRKLGGCDRAYAITQVWLCAILTVLLIWMCVCELKEKTS